MKEGRWKCRSDGQRGKPKPGFPRCPQPFGNHTKRDSHIFHRPARRGKLENQKQVSHFPTCCLFLSQIQTKKGGLAADRFAPAFRLILGLENAAPGRQPVLPRLDFDRAAVGACEARLFQFTGQEHGDGKLPLNKSPPAIYMRRLPIYGNGITTSTSSASSSSP
jgi:hypothetical protein